MNTSWKASTAPNRELHAEQRVGRASRSELTLGLVTASSSRNPASAPVAHEGQSKDPGALRPWAVAMAGLILVQSAVGMAVDLYVRIPASHPGANPNNYFTGSYHSVAWALSKSPATLASHAGLGLIVVMGAVFVAVRALSYSERWVSVLAWLAG